MGSQPWGGQTIPVELVTTFSAFAGLNANAAGTFAGGPVFPTYNLKEEMMRLWYLQRDCSANSSFDEDDGVGNLEAWFANYPARGTVLPGAVLTSGWEWNPVSGMVEHGGAVSYQMYQPQSSQTIPIQHGLPYQVVFTVSSRTAGGVKVRLGDGGGGEGTLRQTNGTFSEEITADLSSNLDIALIPTSDFDGHIESIRAYSIQDSPYGLASLQDPNPDVDAADARYATFDATITAMNPVTDWHDDAVAAKAVVDDHISWIADINTIVTTYESGKLPELQRSQARFLAQLADVGAIHSTAAFKGLAIMEGEFNRDSGNFRSQAMLIGYQERAKAILQGVSDAQMARRFKIEAGRLSTVVKAELSKFNILANTDYIKQQLMLDTEAELWNVNLLDRVKSVNMISGANVLQRGMSTEQALTSVLFSVAGGAMNMLPMLLGGK